MHIFTKTIILCNHAAPCEITAMEDGYDWERLARAIEANYTSFLFVIQQSLRIAKHAFANFRNSYILVNEKTVSASFNCPYPKLYSHSCTLVNVTTSSMIPNIPYLSISCSLKSARESLVKSISIEYTSTPTFLKAVTYCEQAYDYHLKEELVDSSQRIPMIRKALSTLREHENDIPVAQRTEALMRLLEEDEYTSGDVVQYYDLADMGEEEDVLPSQSD